MKSFFYQQINEELLVEKKLQDQYKERLAKVATTGDELMYNKIIKADRTVQGLPGQESGDYINWIAKVVLNYAEVNKHIDMSRVREYLKRFEQYKQWWRRNKAQVKKEEEPQNAIQRQINPDLLVQKIPSFDINTYKNFSDLATKLENIYDFIKHYGYSTENKEAKKEAGRHKAFKSFI